VFRRGAPRAREGELRGPQLWLRRCPCTHGAASPGPLERAPRALVEAGCGAWRRPAPSLIIRLGLRRHLGEGLRALLAAEVRGARLTGRAACERAPAHLPPGCAATRCALRLASSATAAVVLGGPVAGARSPERRGALLTVLPPAPRAGASVVLAKRLCPCARRGGRGGAAALR